MVSCHDTQWLTVPAPQTQHYNNPHTAMPPNKPHNDTAAIHIDLADYDDGYCWFIMVTSQV